MRHIKLLFLAGLSSIDLFGLSQNNWQPRPFSASSVRNLILMKEAYQQGQDPDIPYYLGVAGDYMQSFSSNVCNNGFQSMPFWSGTTKMTIGNNDGKSDLDAYQFGMYNVVTPGEISIKTDYKNFGADVMWYFVQNHGSRGWVGKIDLPLGALKTNVNLCEKPAVLSGAADAVWNLYPPAQKRPQTLTEAFNGGIVGCDNLINSGYLNTIALYSGKISAIPLTTIRVADLGFTLGYNVLYEERGFVMLGFKVTCPTGNVATGRYIYEPIFGRGGHWGVGLETSASVDLHSTDCSNLRLWMQGEILHLFNGRTGMRSFDLLQNGPGSKYLLLQYYAPGNPNFSSNPVNPTGRTPLQITQAVNVTTLPVKSSFDVEGSFAFMLDWTKNDWNAGLGAEVWGRTREHLCVNLGKALQYGAPNLNDFAVLGRQIGTDTAFNNPYQLALCEPLARINESLDVVLPGGVPPAGPATAPTGYDTTKIKDARLAENRIPANISEALDVCGAQQPKAIVGKVFGEVGYTWKELQHTPNISLFGGAEFASKCSNLADMWSVGLKGSFNF